MRGRPGVNNLRTSGRVRRLPRRDPGFEPAGVKTVGHSFVPASDGNGSNAYSDATLYTAPSGATVFAAGTIQWSWGVDNGYNDGYCGCPAGYSNSASQRITENVLDRLSGG